MGNKVCSKTCAAIQGQENYEQTINQDQIDKDALKSLMKKYQDLQNNTLH